MSRLSIYCCLAIGGLGQLQATSIVNVTGSFGVNYAWSWQFTDFGYTDTTPASASCTTSSPSIAVCNASNTVSESFSDHVSWDPSTNQFIDGFINVQKQTSLTVMGTASPELLAMDLSALASSSVSFAPPGPNEIVSTHSLYSYTGMTADLSSSGGMQILAPGNTGFLRFTWEAVVPFNRDIGFCEGPARISAVVAGTTFNHISDCNDTIQATFPVPFGALFTISTGLTSDLGFHEEIEDSQDTEVSLRLTQLDVLASDMSVLSGVRYRSSFPISSGFSVPEPATSTIVFFGLLILARRKYIRRRDESVT